MRQVRHVVVDIGKQTLVETLYETKEVVFYLKIKDIMLIIHAGLKLLIPKNC